VEGKKKSGKGVVQGVAVGEAGEGPIAVAKGSRLRCLRLAHSFFMLTIMVLFCI
jgi:hypothetical protein